MEIDGPKRKRLRLALMDAYPTLNRLSILTQEVLNEPLQYITIANDMPTVVFDLIGWAKSRGRLTELVIGAASENPDNKQLRGVADLFTFAKDVAGEVERIVLKSVPFQDIGPRLDKMTRLKRALCRIEPQPPPNTNGHGSGFLVAPEVLLTNYHVIRPFLDSGADMVVARFGFETGLDGVSVFNGHMFKLAKDWKLAYSAETELDFALLRLAGKPGDAVGLVASDFPALAGHDFVTGEPLLILQHPDAEPLKLSIGSVVAPDNGKRRVNYTANTKPGSSGSPCFTSAL